MKGSQGPLRLVPLPHPHGAQRHRHHEPLSKPRVWFDMSGNKLAMLGNAKSWYDVFPEVDYIIGQYPMLTSFHIEAC